MLTHSRIALSLIGRSAAGRGCSPTTAAESPSAAVALGTAGNGDVLLAIQHERHGRTHLVEMGVHIQKLLAGIGAIDPKVASHAGEYEVAGGGERTALVKARGAVIRVPAFLLGHRVPCDQRRSGEFRSNPGNRHWRGTARSTARTPATPTTRSTATATAATAAGRTARRCRWRWRRRRQGRRPVQRVDQEP